MSQSNFDLVVIGAGPGGYVAAIRAAQLGMKTAIIERENLGGICLNWGCIPTKALLRSAEMYQNMKHAAKYGLSTGEIGFDLQAIVKRSRAVSKQLTGGVGFLMKKNKITVIDGTAKLAGSGKIDVTGKDGASSTVTGKHIIIATGARARSFPGLEPDGKKIWTYREALVPDIMPKSLLVVGSGAIGIEFASFFNTLGAKVTVVEMMDRVMPVEDEEISALARKSFEKQGMTIHTGAKVSDLKSGASDVTATITLKDGKSSSETFERVILAVGIIANSENLGLEEAGVKVERGDVLIDEFCRTTAEHVYAIGDVAGAPALAHKASHEAIICVEKIAGQEGVHPLDRSNIPGCTYCTPQVASVGMTEKVARGAGHELKIGKFPYQANGKAIALGETEGMIKTIFDVKTGELLGAHMIGAEVTELIQGFVIAMNLETTEAELMHSVFPHPTLSEMMHESTLEAFGRALHV
ncbi:MAG: dihydrolipoyl dehydrogenase [Hyphomicrobiaceae bacterium]|nr:dihydrolipoyl dehydrogenase [Hyphomicrobiaceae bacterium]